MKGSPEATKTIQDVAFATFSSHDLPDGMEPINAGHLVDWTRPGRSDR
ncbi:hypothetical protein OG520_36345 [Streptomyces sp. NBC_00984]|nr:hypothetical protein OG520_36345 [Streptomyces sp. NBC_00984]